VYIYFCADLAVRSAVSSRLGDSESITEMDRSEAWPRKKSSVSLFRMDDLEEVIVHELRTNETSYTALFITDH
jgi:hypothetical protein